MDTCLCCGQPIAEGRVCGDCERELGGNYRIEGRTVYIPADYYPGQTDDDLDAHLADEFSTAWTREWLAAMGFASRADYEQQRRMAEADGELMDPLGATLTEEEQRERFVGYGNPDRE